MKKRIGSVLLALALCLSLLPATALAEDEGDTESSATTPSAEMPAYSGGSGTETDPWQICNCWQIQSTMGMLLNLMQTALIPGAGFPEITMVTTSNRQRTWI